MTRSVTSRLGLLALLVVGLAAAIRADEAARPFSATLDGFASPVFLPDGCTIVNDEHGTGNAQHLGAITWVSHETVDVCSDPAGGIVTGQITLTAANGDQLFGEYQAVAVLDFVGGQVSANGQLHFTGGTGRFEGASGGGVISALGRLTPPFDLVGGISGIVNYQPGR
jgi:hypothetical protein